MAHKGGFLSSTQESGNHDETMGVQIISVKRIRVLTDVCDDVIFLLIHEHNIPIVNYVFLTYSVQFYKYRMINVIYINRIVSSSLITG